MERYKIQVSYRLNGMRMDHAVAESIPGMSRRRAKAIIDTGGVYLNRKRIRVASRTVGKGDQIEVEYNPDLFQLKTKQKLALNPEDILYQDAELIVINKPAGLPSQATRDQAILHVIPVLEKLLTSLEQVPGDLQLVHRLDKDTTGCLIIARNKAAMTFLTEQFRSKTLDKTYHALCWGLVAGDFEETCHLSAIQANTGRVKAMRSGGKFSHTRFSVLRTFPHLQVSLVSCKPITGRSHQIRVHLEKNNHPIVGDKVYGDASQRPLPPAIEEVVTHQLLHAHTISFERPGNGQKLTVTAPYPQTFAQFMLLADQAALHGAESTAAPMA